MKKATDFTDRFWGASNEDERNAIINEFTTWFGSLSADEQDQAREALQPFLDQIERRLGTLEIKADLLGKGELIYEGRTYPLHEWLTLTNYAKLHGLQVNQVQNWINRGIVPKEKMLIVPELNNLKLLHNEQYMRAS